MSGFDHKFKQNEKEKLQALISNELCRISSNYTQDGVLPEYVLVMVQNKKTKTQIANDLEAFLGKQSTAFADWLWSTIEAFLSGDQDISVKLTTEPEDKTFKKRDNAEVRRPASVIVVDSAVKSEEVVRSRNQMIPNSRLILNAVKDANDSILNKSASVSDRIHVDNREKQSEHARKSKQDKETPVASVRTRRTYKVKNVAYRKEDKEKNKEYDEDEEVTFTVTMNNEFRSNKRERTVIDNNSNKDIDMDASAVDSSVKKVKKVKCEYWPLCKRGGECLFWHPNELCKNLPKCLFGDKCLYIHPNTSISIPCKYGIQCASKECMFLHPPGYRFVLSSQNTPSASIPCKHGFACHKDSCVYAHPLVKCKFGFSCVNGPSCVYSHASSCRFGAECSKIDCSFAHPSKSIPCKFGPNCNNKNSCKFVHDTIPIN